jgi:hypothetical protein
VGGAAGKPPLGTERGLDFHGGKRMFFVDAVVYVDVDVNVDGFFTETG